MECNSYKYNYKLALRLYIRDTFKKKGEEEEEEEEVLFSLLLLY
jgi:hypothetical protein